jgi:signal transduction histidine kinase/predicted ATPase
MMKIESVLTQPISFVGRDNEISALLNYINDDKSSRTSLLLIEGPAGVGKTSLVQHTFSKYQKENCFKIYGKFRSQTEKVPYQALKQAFKDWTNQILVLPEEELATLRENAISALQGNLQVVTSVFEELEFFFGKKNLMATSPLLIEPHQIRSKFYYFFSKFLKSITLSGYQLVIYLDDLQWADNATLTLLQDVMNSNNVSNLIIVGAFRPIEDKSKFSICDFIEKYEDRVFHLSLDPFDFSQLVDFIPKYWNFDMEDANAFSKYLWIECEGNPFKIGEVIKAIEKEKLVETKAQQESLFWNNLPKINSEKNSEVFLQKQLERLPEKRKQLIGIATCVGYYFKPNMLSTITGMSLVEIKKELFELMSDHLIVKKADTYFFIHDNIFAACNALIPIEEKAKLHYQLGFHYLESIPHYHHNDFFHAVNHLNRLIEMEVSTSEVSSQLILLNIHAAHLAIKSSAFERASKYYYFADHLYRSIHIEAITITDNKLGDIFGTYTVKKSDIEFSIRFGLAETMFLMQNFQEALQISNQVLMMPINRHQKVKATLINMRLCSAMIYQKDTKNLLLDGLSSLENVLEDFGIYFPKDQDLLMKEVSSDCETIRELASEINTNTDYKALLNHDEEYQDFIKLVVTSLTFTYYLDVNKGIYLVIKLLLMNLRNGLAPISSVMFAVSFLIGSFGPPYKRLGYLLGKISLKMIEQEPFKSYLHIVYYIATLNFYAWDNHYKECVKKLKLAVDHAMVMGDHHYVSFCSTIIRLLNIYRGKNLKKHVQLSQDMEKNNRHIFFISGSDSDFANMLIGTKKGFVGGNIKFSTDLYKVAEYSDSAKYHLYHAIEKLEFMAGNLDAAIAATHEVENIKNVYNGFQIEVEHNFYCCLIVLQNTLKKPEQAAKLLPLVETKLQEFKYLSSFNSGNYLHKAFLIEAELCRNKGQFKEASQLYDSAIDEAEKQKFINNAAIASELAGNFYLSQSRFRLGKYYLKQSMKFYSKWGADAKVNWLKKHFDFLDKQKKVGSHEDYKNEYYTIRSIVNNSAILPNQDLRDFGKHLIHNLSINAKSENGAILVNHKDRWQILALQDPSINLEAKGLDCIKEELPTKIINYAIHLAETVKLENVNENVLFSSDPYLKNRQVQNIYCFPISFGSETIGLIYLDNMKLSKSQSELFSLIIEHASTTLSNAISYENMSMLNRELQIHEQKRVQTAIESQEKERQRIAEELHDSLGQMLALIKLNFSRFELPMATAETHQLMSQTGKLLDESCDELRMISHNLMPPNLDEKDFAAILETLIKKNVTLNHLTYTYQPYGVNDNLDVAVKFTVYRIIQEILHNIIKHASATHVTLSITQSEDGINIMAEDNGKGFDKNLVEMGLGLKNIHSRVKLLNGYFDVDSAVNRGTIFNITIPLNLNNE